MPFRSSTVAVLAACALPFAAASALAQAGGFPRFSVAPIKPELVRPLGTAMWGAGIAADGEVAVGFKGQIWRWREGGRLEAVPDLPGGFTGGGAAAMNPGGVIAGWGYAEGGMHAAIFHRDGSSVDLGALLPPYWPSSASAISSNGIVVGSQNRSDDLHNRIYTWIWSESSGMKKIRTMPSGAIVAPQGVNASGTVVGYASEPDGYKAVRWVQGGRPVVIEGADRAAYAINDDGLIVGGLETAFAWHPDTGLELLPPMPKSEYCTAMAVNNLGQVVGFCFGGTYGRRATLWARGVDGHWGVRTLRSLADSDGDGEGCLSRLCRRGNEAYGINDAGQITLRLIKPTGIDDSDFVVLNPKPAQGAAPEPAR